MPHHDPMEYPENPCQTGDCEWRDKQWGHLGGPRSKWCTECAVYMMDESHKRVQLMRDYWLCVDGFTFAQFLAGGACDECGMGTEHREAALAADDYGSHPALGGPGPFGGEED